jgi:hypothetical protein
LRSHRLPAPSLYRSPLSPPSATTPISST